MTRMAGDRMNWITDVPMYYRMPAEGLRPDLLEKYPGGTTTLDLIKAGYRTSTTRRPFAQPGNVITFKGHGDPYRVVSVGSPDLRSDAGRKAWEDAEGWSLRYIDADPRLKAQVYSPYAVQTLFQPLSQSQPANKKIYAGVGSRKTPENILNLMTALAGRMEQDGWLLRTGEAVGADTAFRSGVVDPAHRTVYLPAARSRGIAADPRQRLIDASSLESWPRALETVTQYHPSSIYKEAAAEMAGTGGLPIQVTEIKRQRFGPKLDRNGRPMTLEEEAGNLAFGVSLQARNAMQVLGPNLDRPANLLVAWTPGGEVNGGTGQSLRIARDHGIEVRNLGKPDVLQRVRQYLGMGAL